MDISGKINLNSAVVLCLLSSQIVLLKHVLFQAWENSDIWLLSLASLSLAITAEDNSGSTKNVPNLWSKSSALQCLNSCDPFVNSCVPRQFKRKWKKITQRANPYSSQFREWSLKPKSGVSIFFENTKFICEKPATNRKNPWFQSFNKLLRTRDSPNDDNSFVGIKAYDLITDNSLS